MRIPAQPIRHLLRLLILLAIIAIPCVAHYRVLVARNRIETVRQQDQSSAPRTTVLLLDKLFGGTANPSDVETTETPRQDNLDRLAALRGNHWSAEIFGFSITDPLAGVESMLTSRAIPLTLLLGLLVPVLGTVILGRVFCSWICPAGFVFELSDHLRRFLARLKLTPANLKVWRGHKYVLLTVGLVIAFLFGVPLLGYFYPPALLGREIGRVADGFFNGLVGDPQHAGAIALSGISLFLFGLVALELFLSPRLWCRYLCPGGALYALLGKWRIVRLKTDHARCTACAECVRVCPVGLDPVHESDGPECDNCLKCQSVCEPKALFLTTSLRHSSTPSIAGDN